jgi:hypothetical protein
MIRTSRRRALALFGTTTVALWADPASARGARCSVAPGSLSLDYRLAPAGMDRDRLRFGWTLVARDPSRNDLRQTACQVLVREGWRGGQDGGALVFDSGHVMRDAMDLTPDRALDLQPQAPYAWMVRVWDGAGVASTWSAPQRFTTTADEPWRGRWIAAQDDGAITAPAREDAPGQAPAYILPLLRRVFTIARPVRHAVLCLSGLGAYDLSINGRGAAPAVMNPGWTDYSRTVLTNTIEVTDLLRIGTNVLAVRLGDGMYDVQARAGRYAKWTGSFGAPKLIAQLRIVFADGDEAWIVSDNQWQTRPGPIAWSSIYGGEDCDARAEPAGWETADRAMPGWSPAVPTRGPGGGLKPQQTPGLIVAATVRTIAVTQPRPGVLVHDLGQNFAGRPVLAVRGSAGAVVTITPGELRDADGRVTQTSMAADAANALRYTYTLGDTPDTQVWRPRFSWSGFRYLEVHVTGQAQVVSLDGEFLHADLPSAGDFACSDDRLNRIHRLIRQAVLSNAATVLTDCPTREKLGWLEQTYLNAATIFCNLQALPLYAKIADDITDAQQDSGMVPSIAPEYVRFVDDKGISTAFRDSPEWGSAAIQSPWAAYRFTGDLALLRRAWPTMSRYAAYLERRSQDDPDRSGLLNFGLGDWYDIGPGAPGQPKLTSRTFVGSATWYGDLVVMARIATLLGLHRDARAYARRAALLKDTINARLFQPDLARYDRGSQTACAMALALDLVPDGHGAQVLANLVEAIHQRRDHVSAGDVGFHYVVRALMAHGRDDLLHTMATRADAPSYTAQIAAGATALTEAWDADPHESQNHFMLGHIETWLFGGLAGLDIDFSRGLAQAIRIAPRPVPGVAWARASHTCPLGEVVSAWRAHAGRFDLDVRIPAGATARIVLPGDGDRSISVGSGHHRFARNLA